MDFERGSHLVRDLVRLETLFLVSSPSAGDHSVVACQLCASFIQSMSFKMFELISYV